MVKHQKKPGAVEPGRTYGYVRVSSDGQATDGHSLNDQTERIRGYATSIGRVVDHFFVEAGVSGGKKFCTRPKGLELMRALERGDVVIGHRLDRLFRSASDALNTVEEFKKRGVSLHLMDIGAGSVTENGVSQLVFSILASVATMERSRISERVRSVKQHLTASGQFTGGKLPFGYEQRDGKLIVRADWTRLKRQMQRLRNEGLTYADIAAAMTRRGECVSAPTVWKVLTNRREIDTVSESQSRP